MGFQFLNLFSGQPASVSDLAVSFYVPHRTHARNDGGYGRVTQSITCEWIRVRLAHARDIFDKCPELPAVFVVVMKNQRRSEL